jgi:hypothetical protein
VGELTEQTIQNGLHNRASYKVPSQGFVTCGSLSQSGDSYRAIKQYIQDISIRRLQLGYFRMKFDVTHTNPEVD